MKFGEFKAKVIGITVSPSSHKPAIMTRLQLEDDKSIIVHVINFTKKNGDINLDAIRIGLDELRGAFPNELAKLSDEDLIAYLMEKTDTLTNRALDIGIEQQTKNGIVQKSDKGEIYYNIRLRSATKNLSNAMATSLAKQMLNRAVTAAQVDNAFKTAADEKPTSKSFRAT